MQKKGSGQLGNALSLLYLNTQQVRKEARTLHILQEAEASFLCSATCIGSNVSIGNVDLEAGLANWAGL